MYKTMFEITVGCDMGDVESGPMVNTYTDYYDCEVNLFQSLDKLFAEVEQKYYAANDDIIGCHVERIVPVVEAEKIREEMEAMI